MTFSNAAPLGLVLLGFMLGMRHATDPDHVIAVTAILTRERRLGTATLIGLVWGLGHTLTVLLVGAAIIVFKLKVPVQLGLAMEFAVALALILLGLGTAGRLVSKAAARLHLISPDRKQPLITHSHTHSHAAYPHPYIHAHPHAHAVVQAAAEKAPPHEHRLPASAAPQLTRSRSLLKSFSIGLVHGLAGSAAIALLVLGAISAPMWAIIYLVVFCAGVIAGMMLITTAIGAPLVLASNRMAGIHHGLTLSAGLLSFGFGLFLAYQIGVVDKLFGAAPIWITH